MVRGTASNDTTIMQFIKVGTIYIYKYNAEKKDSVFQ